MRKESSLSFVDIIICICLVSGMIGMCPLTRLFIDCSMYAAVLTRRRHRKAREWWLLWRL